MNDYDYILLLERLTKYTEEKQRVATIRKEASMIEAYGLQWIKLTNILDVHMQNSIARAVTKGEALKKELEQILANAKI